MRLNLSFLGAVGYLCFVVSGLKADMAIFGETVYTMAGKPIQNGVVLVRHGKIEAVGERGSVIVPSHYRVLTAKVVTPGLIDAHSVVGLSGILNYCHDQEQLERSAPMQPELRAIDAYNPHDFLVEWLRGFGITTVHTGHAPGALISGQTMVIKTIGNSVDEGVIVPFAMVAVTFGENSFAGQGAPGTRSKAVAMLRSELLRVQNDIKNREDKKKKKTTEQKEGEAQKEEAPPRNLRDEIFERILRREIPLLITAHRHQDILSALRMAEEFNLRIVLDGAAEGYLLTNEIKKANVPVVIHPTMYRAYAETENLSMETAATLKHAGIPIALQSGYEDYVPKTRVVLFEAGLAAAYGLNFEEALATVTIEAARILGIGDRVGSLEQGKDADIALYDGDPFEYTTHCIGVVVNGKLVASKSN